MAKDGCRFGFWRLWRCCQHIIGLCCIWSALGTSLVHAAGIEYPDNGTIAIGRGGAYAARPSDGLALYYNPAGLAYQKGWQLTLDGRLANQSVSFRAQDVPTDTRFADGTVRNEAGLFFAPAGVISYGFGEVGPFSSLSVAGGAFGPSAIGRLAYPADGPQRYALIRNDLFLAYYSLGVAASLWNKVAFGATFQLGHGSIDFAQALYSNPLNAGFASSDDTQVSLSAQTALLPTGTLGISATPLPGWHVGFSYRFPVELRASGTLDTELGVLGESFGISTQGDQAEIRLDLPDIFRLGVQYEGDGWLVELNGVYERWSSFDAIRVDASDVRVVGNSALLGNVDVPVGQINIPRNLKDAFSVRFGGDMDIVPERFLMRAGYLYESSAISKEYAAVDFPHFERHAASIGAGLRLWGVHLNLAYAYHFVATQEITQSRLEQVVTPPLTPGSDVPASVVGNGTLRSSLQVFSASLQVALDGWNSQL